MCVSSTRLRDAFHATVTLRQRITEDKMEALLRFYLHPADQVDLFDTLFLMDTYLTALTGPPIFI